MGEYISSLVSYDLRRKPDLLIVMGTSLKVHGVKQLVRDLGNSVKQAKNGKVILINATRLTSDWDSFFDITILGKSDDVIQNLETLVFQPIPTKNNKKLIQTKLNFQQSKKRPLDDAVGKKQLDDDSVGNNNKVKKLKLIVSKEEKIIDFGGNHAYCFFNSTQLEIFSRSTKGKIISNSSISSLIVQDHVSVLSH